MSINKYKYITYIQERQRKLRNIIIELNILKDDTHFLDDKDREILEDAVNDLEELC